jgi:tetratricopeptide (TPR) repeat protein
MTSEEQVLDYLKRITDFTDRWWKLQKRSLIFVAIFIPAMVITGIGVDHISKSKVTRYQPPIEDTWFQVDEYVRAGDMTKARGLSEVMIKKMPRYPLGHEKMGNIYLIAGDLKKAQEHYREAYRLFPSEQNRKNLDAIDQAAANETEPKR